MLVDATQRHIKSLFDGLLCDRHLLSGQAKHRFHGCSVTCLGFGFVIPVERQIPLSVFVVFGRPAGVPQKLHGKLTLITKMLHNHIQ